MILANTGPRHYRYYIEEKDEGKIQKALKNYGFSSRLVKFVKREGELLCNDKPVRFIDEVKAGDIIDVFLPEENIDNNPDYGNLDIIYEDDEILVVNKPPMMVTHPTKEYQEKTLANYIAGYYEKTNQNHKIRFVNRLDRDTTGLVIIAKNKFVHHYIQSRMKTDDVKKTYIALAEGKLEKKEGKIDLPIFRPSPESIERVIDDQGLPSVTNYKVLQELPDATLVECELETGRTHQIRVHLKAIGNPIIGDPLYNPESVEKYNFDRQALHSYKLELKLPKRGKQVFQADLPEDMINLESRLSNE